MKFSRGDGTNETTTTTTTAAPTTTVAGDGTADGDNAEAASTNTSANATDDTDDNSERRKRKVEVTTTTSTTTTPIVYNSYFVKVHLETQFKYSNITKKEFKVFFLLVVEIHYKLSWECHTRRYKLRWICNSIGAKYGGNTMQKKYTGRGDTALTC